MLWFFYNFLFFFGFLLLLPRAIRRMTRRGGYMKNFGQRFGRFSPELRAELARTRRVWIHAVSVGEIFVALEYMKELRRRHPEMLFLFSTTTSTGHAMAEKNLPAHARLIYFPVDFPWIVNRVLALINPVALVLVENELWPNMVRLARRRGIPIMLVNGRISEHSYRGYSRLKVFTRPLLSQVDLLCVQSDNDRQRLLSLGGQPDRLHVVGSAKYDLTPSGDGGAEKARKVLETVGITRDHLVLLGGSTWPGEEAILLDIYKTVKTRFPKLVLVLVPRHFERAPEVLKELEVHGVKYVRRSQMTMDQQASSTAPDVLLVDTTGELRGFYACADIIFVGKSLTQHGGQNIIEPAMAAKPVIVGPNMENFAPVMSDFLAAEAMLQVQNGEELKNAIERLLADAGLRKNLSERAARLVREKAGVVKKTIDLVEPVLLRRGS